jgi:hypothetical protein
MGAEEDWADSGCGDGVLLQAVMRVQPRWTMLE